MNALKRLRHNLHLGRDLALRSDPGGLPMSRSLPDWTPTSRRDVGLVDIDSFMRNGLASLRHYDESSPDPARRSRNCSGESLTDVGGFNQNQQARSF
jgi:hypothetical protein